MALKPSPLGAFGWFSGLAELPLLQNQHGPCLLPRQPLCFCGPRRLGLNLGSELTSLTDHLASFHSRLPQWAQTSSLGPHAHWTAAPSCSQWGAPMTAAWTSLSAMAMTLVPQDWCLTTEPRKRSCTPARGLLPLCWGAQGTWRSCLGPTQPHCKEARTGSSRSHRRTSPQHLLVRRG